MKKLSVILAGFILIFGMSKAVFAQTDSDTETAAHGVTIEIPTLALVDIEDTDGEVSTITLKPIISATEAGEAVDFSNTINNSLWLNYTSIVAPSHSRNITVEMTGEALPSGFNLNLSASAASEDGNGKKGSPNETISLSSTAKPLISGIGSTFTGTGAGKGHQLTYSLSMNNDNYTTLVAKEYNLTVTYTITGE